MTDDEIKDDLAIISAATDGGELVKGKRFDLARSAGGTGRKYHHRGNLVDILTEPGGAELFEAVPIADADFVIAAYTRWPAAIAEVERLRRVERERAFEAQAIGRAVRRSAAEVSVLEFEGASAPPLSEETREALTALMHRARKKHEARVFWDRVADDLERLLGIAIEQAAPASDPDRIRCAAEGCESWFLKNTDGGLGWAFGRGSWFCPDHQARAASRGGG